MTISNTAGAYLRLFYDHRGQVAKTEDDLGNRTVSSFDALHRVTGLLDTHGRSESFAYACCGVVTSQTDPAGQVERFTYTPTPRRLDSSTDALGNATHYHFDGHGNLTAITAPDATQQRFTYDAVGNPQSVINRRGQTETYAYNPAGQVSQEVLADGQITLFAYNSRGALTSVSNLQGAIAFAYDERDQLTNITYPNGRFLTFTYDEGGRRSSMVDHLGYGVFYAFDPVGRLSALTNAAGALMVGYSYDLTGRLIREDRGNGTYVTYDYDAGGRLTKLVNHAPDGSTNSWFEYQYDSLGRTKAMALAQGEWTYEYDPDDELAQAVFASSDPAVPSQDLTYVYDLARNRVRVIANGATSEYTANNLNQYTSAGASTFGYDADGNLTSETNGPGVTHLVYDSQN